jgi:hypothetical protein
MAVHLTPAQRASWDRVMRDTYPEYGPYMDARAAGISHDNAWLIACAKAAGNPNGNARNPVEKPVEDSLADSEG